MAPSNHESFWNAQAYAVVGHSAKRPFPRLTYRALKDNGKTVYAVDPGTDTVEGDRSYPDLASLPAAVQAVVVEVPKEETGQWVERAAAAGIKDVWLHANTDTPDAVAIAQKHQINLRTGTCAVMYLTHGFTFHSIHRVVNKIAGKY
jgi:predicted CoA-binding protein